MLKPKGRPATYADIEALPPNMVGEILFGVLYAHPRPAARHGVATYQLAGELGPPFGRARGGPGGWLFMVAPELHLGSHVVVPDLAGWKRERLKPLPRDGLRRNAARLAVRDALACHAGRRPDRQAGRLCRCRCASLLV